MNIHNYLLTCPGEKELPTMTIDGRSHRPMYQTGWRQWGTLDEQLRSKTRLVKLTFMPAFDE